MIAKQFLRDLRYELDGVVVNRSVSILKGDIKLIVVQELVF